MLKRTLIAAFLALPFLNVYSQKASVNVNQFTGTANVSIPLMSISNAGASVPISLIYSATGVKPKDVEGEAGMGWQLQAGGQISRTVRGLPDDVTQDNIGSTRLGWLNNSYGSTINSFSIANNGSTCSYETTDISNMMSDFNPLYDTEPDMFTVNAPGLNCQFVFDASHAIKTIPYMDVKITYTTDGTTGLINAFTVVNSQGTTYVFDVVQRTARQTANLLVGDWWYADALPMASIVYFQNDFYRYKNAIVYNSVWSLSSITDANGNAVTLTYTADSEKEGMTPMQLYIGSTTKTTLYYDYTYDIQNILTGIAGPDTYCTLTYNKNLSTNAQLLQSIQGNTAAYLFNYSNVAEPSGGTNPGYGRFFLRDLSTDQCNVPFRFHFDYLGETAVTGGYTTDLPDSTSNHYDAWGYFNGPLSTTRVADGTQSVHGSLYKITYDDNATTTLSYESNDYYDPVASANVSGGGIRVNQITDYDGISTSNNMVRNYSYTDPTTGNSSGKPVTLPQYSFYRPNSGSSTVSTVTSDLDLSQDDHTIIYGSVKVGRPGAGYSVYTYSTPGTYFDTSGPDGWTPVTDYTGRQSCTDVLGYAGNHAYSYPFVPATNLDFERGLLTKVINYNYDIPTSTATEVSETNYTYSLTSSTIAAVNGFRYDYNDYAIGYSKYEILTSASELVASVTNKIFDLGSTSLYHQSTVNYTYGSSHHFLPTQVQTTNSDGTSQTVNTKYVKDYTTSGSSINPDVVALYNLQQENINMPVETYTQSYVPSLSTTLTTSGSLTQFSSFPNSTSGYNYLPFIQRKFVSASGLSSFTPSSSTTSTFSYDTSAGYLVSANYNNYDVYGVLQGADNNYKHRQAIIADNYNHRPLAVFDNAINTDVSYTNFILSDIFPVNQPRPNGSVFNKDNHTYFYATGRSTGVALALEAYATLTNSSITVSDQDDTDIFSFWVNSSSISSGTITLALTGANSATPTPITIGYTTLGGPKWRYYSVKVPVSGLGGSFSATFSSNAGVNIDDILMYPEHATVSCSAYDPATLFKMSDTKTNGITQYYTYDNVGRVLTVIDKDLNVIKNNTYYVPENTSTLPDPTFVWDRLYRGEVTTFTEASTYNPCLYSGVTFTYTWDFGDGSSTVTGTTPTHTYSANGPYTVTCYMSASGYTTTHVDHIIYIGDPPPPPHPSGIQVYGTDFTGSSSFNYVDLTIGGVTTTLTPTQLAGGTVWITPGVYTVKVSVAGSSTYGSVLGYSDSDVECNDWFHSNTYTFSMDLTYASFFTIEINPGACP